MGKYLGALLAVLAAAGIVFGVATVASYAGRTSPLMTGTAAGTDASTGLQHVTLNLQTFPFSPYTDPAFIQSHVTGQSFHGFPYPGPGDNQAWVLYWPTTSLQVPRHTLVTVNIENYDSATPLLNPYYATPRGTMGNSMLVDGKTLTQQDPANVSHTFTIHSIAQSTQPWLFVSVPLTAVASDAKVDDAGMALQPVVTTFSFITPDQPGNYIWQCFDPCGSQYNGFGGPMSTRGYMSGTFDVV
jgi:hypothetical protein